MLNLLDRHVVTKADRMFSLVKITLTSETAKQLDLSTTCIKIT